MVPQWFLKSSLSRKVQSRIKLCFISRFYTESLRISPEGQTGEYVRVLDGNPPHTHTPPLPTPSQSIWGLLYHLLEVQIFSSPGPLRYRYTIGTVDGSLFHV